MDRAPSGRGPCRPGPRTAAPLLASLLLAPALAAQAPERPRIVLLIVLDQVATWVYEAARPHFGEDGFAAIEREGVRFRQCAFAHAPTWTGPGHASIATGAVPLHHGITGNHFLVRPDLSRRYCVESSTSGAVGDAASGRSADLLLAPTLGDTMKAHLGARARVAAVSWKDRAAILLAGRSGDLVLWAGPEGFVSSPAFEGPSAQVLSGFHAEAPWRAWSGQEWSRFGPPEAYGDLEDDRPFEPRSRPGTSALPRPYGLWTPETHASFFGALAPTPAGNELVARLALLALEAIHGGEDEVPDLLAVSLSAHDLAGHAADPRSVEVRDLLLRADRIVAGLRAAAEARAGVGRVLVIVTGDHGIAPAPEALPGGRVGARIHLLDPLALRVNQALVARFGPPPAPHRRYVARIEGHDLFLDEAAVAAQGLDPATLRRAAAEAARLHPGVHLALPRDELDTASPDPILRALALGAHPLRSGDVRFAPSPYLNDGTSLATHGSPYTYDRAVPLLVQGPGIRAGTVLEVPVTPGAGVVLASQLLRIPAPACAFDPLPEGALVEGAR
jgi:hypothetical protein